MHRIKPQGEDQITCTTNEHIVLEDMDVGSRVYTTKIVVKNDNTTVRIEGKMYTQHADKKQWNISVVLCGKNQSVTLYLRGIADDKSRIIFDGAGILEKNSLNGTIRIDEKVILFSKSASAEAVPVLRVETEHVSSASHSASITPFSEEILFFMASRGISEQHAKELLKEGMLQVS